MFGKYILQSLQVHPNGIHCFTLSLKDFSVVRLTISGGNNCQVLEAMNFRDSVPWYTVLAEQPLKTEFDLSSYGRFLVEKISHIKGGEIPFLALSISITTALRCL